MPLEYPQEAIDLNATLDARQLLTRMGYTNESIYAEGDLIRVFCPIHKDQVRRSMVIDANERTYRCQYTQCPAHQGGLLIGLYALYADVNLATAIDQLSGKGVDATEEASLLNQAAQLIETGKYAEAMAILSAARQLNPINTITRCKIASLYLEMGDKGKGQQEYLAAAEDFGVKGELDKTLSVYNLLIILSPQDLKVRKQLAYLFSRLGRAEDAAEHLKWALDQYLATGQMDEAMQMCEQMAVLTPREPMIHGLLADILVQHGALDHAVAEYETSARLLLERNQTAAAKEMVIKGLRYIPGHPGLAAMRDQIEAANAAGAKKPAGASGGGGAMASATAIMKDALAAGGEDATAAPATKEDGEDDFAQWIASLEDEIEKPMAERLESVEISSDDARVIMCRSQLETIEDKKLGSMETFLRDMFQDVKRNYEAGVMSPSELRVVKEFYRAFCIAYEQIRRERGL